jgi:hypothetical protein
VTAADLEAAERAQHVRIRTGDLLFVRVGIADAATSSGLDRHSGQGWPR